MAELVDALASGASVLTDVEVQVLFWAPSLFIQLESLVFAQVAELVDALASGASILTDVEVQVLSWAPSQRREHDGDNGNTRVAKARQA
jgi:precorrin isomerase